MGEGTTLVKNGWVLDVVGFIIFFGAGGPILELLDFWLVRFGYDDELIFSRAEMRL